MNINDGYFSKIDTFNTQEGLEEKIDRLMSIMNNWQLKMMTKLSNLSLRYIRVKEEVRQEPFMIDVIMVKEIIRTDIDQIVEVGEFCLVVE